MLSNRRRIEDNAGNLIKKYAMRYLHFLIKFVLVGETTFISLCCVPTRSHAVDLLDPIRILEAVESQIVEIGRRSAAQLDATQDIAQSDDPNARRVQNLITQHRAEDGLSINVRVYNSRDVNAFALPDGSIRLYSGLVETLTDNEILFVLGHEIGHVKRKHARTKLGVAYGMKFLLYLMKAGDDALKDVAESTIVEKAQQFTNAQFSQLEESDADEYALFFLVRHHYPTQAALTTMEKFMSTEGRHDLFSSHPSSVKRRDTLVRLIAQQTNPASPNSKK